MNKIKITVLKEVRNMMFEVGDIVALPKYDIARAMIVGVECYFDEYSVDSIDEINPEEFECDYLVSYLENGEILKEWYSESWINAINV